MSGPSLASFTQIKRRKGRVPLVPQIKVRGANQAVRKLNRELQRIMMRTHGGIIKAALLLLRESQRIVPVDHGNLRSSGYIAYKKSFYGRGGLPVSFAVVGKGTEANKSFVDVPERSPAEASRMSRQHEGIKAGAEGKVTWLHAIVGYSAYYAGFVHELPFRHAQGKTWKFLYIAALNYRREIVKTVKREIWYRP